MSKGVSSSSLTIAHANSYSGGTTVSAGTVIANNATALGTGPVTVNSAMVSYSAGGSVAWPNAFTLAGGTIRHFAASATQLTLAGGVNLSTNSFFRIKIHDPTCLIDLINNPITGSGGFTLTDENVATTGTAGSPVLRLSVGGNSYMGDTTIASGTVRMNAANALPSGSGKGNVILDGGTNLAGTLDLNGRDTSINGLFGTNNAVLGMVTNSSASAATLTVGIANVTSGFSGIIGGLHSPYEGRHWHADSCWCEHLFRRDDHQRGGLLVNGAIGSSAVTVATNAWLGGSGSIGGSTTVQSGGTIQGGNATGAGTLTVGTLNLGDRASAASYSSFTIVAGGKISATTLNVTGTNIINILDGSLSVGTNTLITYVGTIGGNGFSGFKLGTLPTLPQGTTAYLKNSGSRCNWWWPQ